MLAADLDAQDVLVLNLSRAVQLCVDLASHVLSGLDLPPPETMGQAFERLQQAGLLEAELALQLRKAVGFRNIAVHAYDVLDWTIVFNIATRNFADFEAFARMIASREFEG